MLLASSSHEITTLTLVAALCTTIVLLGHCNLGFCGLLLDAAEEEEQLQAVSSLFFATAKSFSALPGGESALCTVTEPESMSVTGTNGPKWSQKSITLPRKIRGCHLVTREIVKEILEELQQFKCGLAHFFLRHTSASLTINENYDSDVQEDTETFLNRIVPEGRSAPWKHTLEGPDDMPAHIKSSMFGCSLTIPITDGELNLGRWQGIWLCEHRDVATPRSIVVTLNGI
ncbi:hypothetical protein MLD38_034318 [Melastoma candidum]|uniref:Uncharacterized protein n=1 Tax=Melastoma candidum TaxID=119954 RepID=A0ACB9MBN7_9MYRT|nr:hypothetical protein MLD38_034318 [Melastoma candidum]